MKEKKMMLIIQNVTLELLSRITEVIAKYNVEREKLEKGK